MGRRRLGEKTSTTKLNNQTKKNPPTTKQKRDITHLDCENKETKLAECQPRLHHLGTTSAYVGVNLCSPARAGTM